MKTKFAPSILVKGRYPLEDYIVTPRGWEWVLAFALAGCDWAIKEASTEKFKKTMRDDLKKTHREELLDAIEHYESKIEHLKEELINEN